jgi:hypothetical protein
MPARRQRTPTTEPDAAHVISESPTADDGGRNADMPFAWQAHPARERPLTAAAACAVVFALALAVYALSEAAVWAVFAVLVLCLSLNRFFFATKYEVDADGITAAMPLATRRLRWCEIRRAELGSRAAWLSPLPRRSWREARRGIHVLFGTHRAQVLTRLRACLPHDVTQ